MKLIFTSIVLINVLRATSARRMSSEDFNEWERFKNDYAKVYNTKGEEVQRMQIFIDNLQFINEHNKKYASEIESYSVKVNQFADLKNEEFRKIMNGYKGGIRKRSNTRNKHTLNHSLPFSVDWRREGAVTEVKDQGYCGSCWAFSTTGSLEGQLFRKTGTLTSLSEQDLVDCSADFGNNGCFGGVMNFAFKYVIKNKGLEPEESYVYVGREGNCSRSSTPKVAGASGFVDIPDGSEMDLMEAVATVGPVSVAIDASYIGLQFYSYGVYKLDICSKSELNHAMLVVGYGTKSGRWNWDGDYWTVKNSWGTSWGMDGYMWMARNLSNMCGIATEASYPFL